MATIKEIAKLADCSIGTVSRVLNFDDSLRVSDEKKQTILRIAEDLQYRTVQQRNAKGRLSVAVVSMYTKVEEIDDPFYLSIRLGVEKRVQTEKIDLIVLNDIGGKYDYDKIQKVDGIIAIGHFTNGEIIAFSDITENIVFVNSNPRPAKYDSILFDGENAVEEAMNYLFNNDHREIGYIGVKSIREVKMVDLAEHRYDLVKNKLVDLGIYNEKFIYRGGKTFSDGYKIMKQLINEDELPSAFFIGNDSMCIGALKALFEAGIKVPKHLSLIGYNDITNSEYTSPALTTIKVYTELMGEKALELLIEKLKGRDIPLKLITPTRLIIRDSVIKHIE